MDLKIKIQKFNRNASILFYLFKTDNSKKFYLETNNLYYLNFQLFYKDRTRNLEQRITASNN